MSTLTFQRAPIVLKNPFFKYSLKFSNPQPKLNILFLIEHQQQNLIQITPQNGVILPQETISIHFKCKNRKTNFSQAINATLLTRFDNQIYEKQTRQKIDKKKPISLKTQRKIKFQETCFIIPILINNSKDLLLSNLDNLQFDESKLQKDFDQISAIEKQNSCDYSNIERTQRKTRNYNHNISITDKLQIKNSTQSNLQTKKYVNSKTSFQSFKQKNIKAFSSRYYNQKETSQSDSELYENLSKRHFLKNQKFQTNSLLKVDKQTAQKNQLKLQFKNQKNINSPISSNTERLTQALKTLRFCQSSQKNLQIIILAIIAGFFFALGANFAQAVK